MVDSRTVVESCKNVELQSFLNMNNIVDMAYISWLLFSDSMLVFWWKTDWKMNLPPIREM